MQLPRRAQRSVDADYPDWSEVVNDDQEGNSQVTLFLEKQFTLVSKPFMLK
jgi:hypothetical protein